MLQATRGIILRNIKYSDSSVILKIYTESHGVQSVITRMSKKAKQGGRMNYLQPLSLVEVSIYQKETTGLRLLKEISPAIALAELHTDTYKCAIAMFMAEVVIKCVKEEEARPDLFNFLWNSILLLDHSTHGFLNFHLVFLANLSRYLGIFPSGSYSPDFPDFDMREGIFVEVGSNMNERIHPPDSQLFGHIAGCSFEQMSQLPLSNTSRRLLLRHWIMYYRLHLPGMGEVKSHLVLEEVLS